MGATAITRPRAIAGTGIVAALLIASTTLASATEPAPKLTASATGTDCSADRDTALACLEGLKAYVRAHPDAPLPTPTTTSTATTSPSPSATATSTPPPIAPTVSATLNPTPGGYASGLPWSSGVWSQHSAAQATAFASMRGKALDNITVFPSRESWTNLLNGWWLSEDTIPAGFKGDIIASVPLWTQNSSVNANVDDNWKSFARMLAAKDGDAYVRLGWEMNLPGSYWKITAANRTNWTAAFNRAVAAMRSVAPKLRIVWNPNWGPDQTDADTRVAFAAVKANVDVYGIDIYDSYPPDNSDVNASARLNGARALNDSASFARANGKRFAVPEWGVACNGAGCQWQGNAGGDNPRYINDLLSFLAAHRTEIAFDSYFNEADSYIKSNLSPTGTNPQAASAYRAKLAALAGQ